MQNSTCCFLDLVQALLVITIVKRIYNCENENTSVKNTWLDWATFRKSTNIFQKKFRLRFVFLFKTTANFLCFNIRFLRCSISYNVFIKYHFFSSRYFDSENLYNKEAILNNLTRVLSGHRGLNSVPSKHEPIFRTTVPLAKVLEAYE